MAQLKHSMKFRKRVLAFREQVQEFTLELCKEENKLDFDRMADLIHEYDGFDSKNIIQRSLQDIRLNYPTIQQAEKKLNDIIEATQFNNKRMMNYLIEKNDLQKSLFFDQISEKKYEYDEETECVGAINNMNYMLQKLESLKELIRDKMHEIIQKLFEDFVREFTHDQSTLFDNKMIFYGLLKTEGDIMIELGDYDKAIQAYKALRNYCRVWGLLE